MNYQCGYCHRYFSRETAFMKHECKAMKRSSEIQTPLGQAAYSLYGKWMRSYNRNVPTIQVFSTSKYYSTFVKIAEFVKGVKLVDVDAFVRLMKDKEIQPSLWTDDRSYVMFIEYMDRHVDPMTRVEITVTELQDMAEELSCDISEVMDHMTPYECIELLRSRVLTPWILPHMDQFKRLFLRSGPEQRQLLETLIRPAYWQLQFSRNPGIVTAITEVARSLNL